MTGKVAGEESGDGGMGGVQTKRHLVSSVKCQQEIK